MQHPKQKFRLNLLSYLVMSAMCLPHSAWAADTVPAANMDTSTSTSSSNSADASNASNSGSDVNLSDVSVNGKKSRVDPQSDQTIDTISKDEIDAAGPLGGSSRALEMSPGVSVSGYGSTGASKQSISINGIKTGWAGFSTSLDNGSIAVTFDGVPMSNPGNGLWQSTLVPENSMLQDIGVTYGPGEPADRWYTNIGGGINFVPLQPSATAGGEVDAGMGSFNSKSLSFSLQTGNLGGWETVVAGGVTRSDSFRQAGDGFANQENDHAFYIKTKKTLENGQWTIGAYDAYSAAWRPAPIPVSPNANTTMAGAQVAGAQLYSQATSGFYSALPSTVNNKFDTNAIDMLWSQLDLALSKNSSIHNLTYFDHESRLHTTALHDYVQAASQPTDSSLYESNTPDSYVFGDKLWTEFNLPYNDITAGGYVQASRYHSIESLYNPAMTVTNPVTGATVQSSASAPTGSYFSATYWQVDSALFLQDKISPIASVHITPGIRFVNYYTSYTTDSAAQYPDSFAANPGNNLAGNSVAATTSFNKTEPSIGINWEANKHVSMYASYARSYRLPEYGGGTGPFVALAPANIQMEQGDYYQAGVLYHTPQIANLRDVDVGLNVYQLKFSNETLPTALASGSTLLAYGSSTYDGVNAFTHFSPIEGMSVFANTGLINATFDNFTNSNGSFNNVPVANVPHITGNLGMSDNIFIGDDLIKPMIVYQYTGSQHIYDNNQNITSDIMLPAYGVVNAAAEFSMPYGTLMGKPNRITVNLSIDNLLGHQYNAFEYVTAGGTLDPTTTGSVLALPAPPRTIFVSLGTKF